jgi:hypothetical protein
MMRIGWMRVVVLALVGSHAFAAIPGDVCEYYGGDTAALIAQRVLKGVSLPAGVSVGRCMSVRNKNEDYYEGCVIEIEPDSFETLIAKDRNGAPYVSKRAEDRLDFKRALSSLMSQPPAHTYFSVADGMGYFTNSDRTVVVAFRYYDLCYSLSEIV